MDFIRPCACAVDRCGCPQPIIDQTALERCQFGEITLKKGQTRSVRASHQPLPPPDRIDGNVRVGGEGLNDEQK
jgi:hypothetical protein